jgi:hypothetical protein
MPHRSRRPALAAALLLITVAACAPAVVGSRGTPFDLRHDRTVTANPASTVYVLAAFDHGAFDYRAEQLGLRWVPWGANVNIAQITVFFRVRDLVAPEGWNLVVEDVRGYDRPNTSGIAVEALLRLEVPAGARLGGQRVRAIIEAQNGTRRPIEIVVQVVP